jgi:regulation of enolase protein 1 (concanavalin A-like superfamily)
MQNIPSSVEGSVRSAIGGLIFMAFVLTSAARASTITVSDSFSTAHTYWNGTTVNVAGTIWGGVLNGQSATEVNADITQAGRLVLSMNTVSSSVGGSYTATTLYLDVTGDFDARVQVPFFSPDQDFESQGIVARSLNGAQGWVMVQNVSIPQSRFRSFNSAGDEVFIENVTNQQSWLRLTRVGDTFQGFYGTDGINWTSYTESAFTPATPLGDTLQVGLFAATVNTAGNLAAQFDNFAITIVPEPAACLLAAAGLLPLVYFRDCGRPSRHAGAAPAPQSAGILNRLVSRSGRS